MTPYVRSSHGLLCRPSLSCSWNGHSSQRGSHQLSEFWIIAAVRAGTESSCTFRVSSVCAVSKWREIRSVSGRPKGGLLLESIKEMCDHACLTKPFCVPLVRWRRYHDDKAWGQKKMQPSAAVLKENCSSTPSRGCVVMRNTNNIASENCSGCAVLYCTTLQTGEIHGARTEQNTADSVGNKDAVAIRCIAVYLV
jgi:hypothetical protein